MADRFFCPDLSGDFATLEHAEAHHALHVMRVKPGHTVTLFDGAGTVAVATVQKASRRDVYTQIVERSFHERRLTAAVTIAAVPPKGDRPKWMVEKLTELGVDRFVPLQCERAVVDPRQSKLDKLSTTVISAAKQCGRAWLMDITEPVGFNDLLDRQTGGTERVLLAHPGARSFQLSSDGVPAYSTSILIGPEGGFTNDEVRKAEQCGVGLVSWGGPILRTETAAVAFATMALAAHAGNQ